jgi:general secretion pathway protein D
MAVNMGDNDVFVIGSLLREKEVKHISEFPLLGDLPLFGFVFRHQNRLIERTEYAIFIVPQVSLDKNFSDRK